MKIIYIVNARIPTEKAHGIQIMHMAEAFASQDAQIELLIPRRFNPIKENPFQYYKIDPVFKITRIPCLDLMPIHVSAISFFLQALTFLIFAKIYLIFKKYDILYTREILAIKLFKNIIIELHSLPHKITKSYKKSLAKAKKIITLNNYIKNNLVKIGINGNKILTVPHGIDFKKFNINIPELKVRGKLGLPLNKKIILYSGSFYLYNWKGVDTFLQSAQFLSNNYLITLVGGKKEEIDDIKNKYKNPNILLIPHQKYDKIPYYLKAANVLVLPQKNTTNSQYLSPLKLIEYMAVQKPIIASDLPHIKEILNGTNAFLVKPGDPIILSQAIKEIISNNDLAKNLAAQSFKDAQNYTYEKRAKKIIEFINKFTDYTDKNY